MTDDATGKSHEFMLPGKHADHDDDGEAGVSRGILTGSRRGIRRQ
jgi:hypothetical protein